MTPPIYLAIGLLAGGIVTALLFLATRGRSGPDEELVRRLSELAQAQEREEKAFRDEFSRSREETAAAAKAQREELSNALQRLNETTVKSISDVGAMLKAPI
ncbi:MAG: hypothetical protein M3Y69_00895, partial [Verrucomicrobiota bacterium]|nr:hypothetical protein [Verrucomicrobiota bacterium]